MNEKMCKTCREYTKHKPYRSNLFKYEGEKVKTCKQCGSLRTEKNRNIIEPEMIHIPTQTKKKNMEDE